MMQVRGAMRERELSIRQAIGASRARLAQYLLSEAIVLACAGGALASLVLFNMSVAACPGSPAMPIPAQLQEALRVDLPMVAIMFRALPPHQPGVRMAAGHALQPSRDHFVA